MAKSTVGVGGKSGKQSALKKLRSALSTAGLTGPSAHVTKKDKKRGVAKSGSAKTAERRQKLRMIQKALNPFELQVNRKKLDVLGLKRKDEVVNVAVARQRAVEKRRATIGEERKNKSRSGGVVDRRIGENDPTMDPEEKMLKRFTAERQQQKKHSSDMFNLEDGDVEGEMTMLTHYGQSIADMNDFDDNMADGSDEEGGAIGGAQVSAGHFGGFQSELVEEGEEGSARKKSKAEVMQEIILKSKQHKQERQLIKEQDEGIRRELDDDFESVRAMLFANDNDGEPLRDAGKPMLSAASEGVTAEEAAPSYDAYVRELGYEQRARPQDRLKTEMEAACEERDRLERAERHRQRRMEGLASDSELDSEDSDSGPAKGYKSKKGSQRRPVGDDLGDDFAAGGGSGKEASDKEASDNELSDNASSDDDDEEDDDDDDASSGEEDEDSGDDEGSVDSDQGESAPANQPSSSLLPASLRRKLVAHQQRQTSSLKDDQLPYTFAAPADYDAWVALASDYSLEQQLTVAGRLRALYHIRLAPQNKAALGALCVILTEHLAVLAEQEPPVPLGIMDGFVRHIGELSSVDPERFGEHCRQAVIDTHRRVQHALKTPGAVGMRASDVALMRVFASVFSASDRYHAVITPMLVVIGQFLSQHTFTTLRDVSCGLVLLGVVHETQRLSRRLVPEALNFLYAAMAASVCRAADAADWDDGQYPLSKRQREALSTLLHIGVAEKCKNVSTPQPVQWSWLLGQPGSGGERPNSTAVAAVVVVTADIKYGILRACLMLSRRFADCYEAHPAFIETFGPLQALLGKIAERLPKFRLQHAPPQVVELLAATRDRLRAQLAASLLARRPLALQSHKPLAIGSFAPKFESAYSLDKHYDPDSSRNEIVKLRRQVNKERRGAVRELRRDAQFVAGERQREQRDRDRAYADKMKKAWGALDAEQGEMKKMDRARIKERNAKV
ncbi:nucleolar complex protein 14 [Coemansia thaxteri]|nr:nucleolar complex protein 14 [Coemansia thaxteri]KAJ2472298.1 nucleolar complex protein 14 [Coemansia sp. RSA 2322]